MWIKTSVGALALCAVLLSAPIAAGQEAAAPQLEGAVFQQDIRDARGTQVGSVRFEISGTRGVYTTWALGQGTERKRCRLEGLVCAFDAHFSIDIAADGESATEVVRRSDGRVLPDSAVLPRVW